MCTGKGLVLLLINHLHGGQQVKEATGMYNVCVIGVNTYKRKLIDWVHCICANYKKNIVGMVCLLLCLFLSRQLPQENDVTPFCRNGIFSRMITTVSPHNPFNKIDF